MTLLEAMRIKALSLFNRTSKMATRSNPRVPHKLQWIAKEFKIFSGKTLVPVGHIPISFDMGSTAYYPTDKIARTFCALEDFEDWLNRVEIGEEKHQKEMERQALTKIVRLKTFAEMGDHSVFIK
mgnify:CR=1 FL=1